MSFDYVETWNNIKISSAKYAYHNIGDREIFQIHVDYQKYKLQWRVRVHHGPRYQPFEEHEIRSLLSGLDLIVMHEFIFANEHGVDIIMRRLNSLAKLKVFW